VTEQGKKKNLSRRRFLKLTAQGAVVATAASCIPHVDGDWDTCEQSEFNLDPSLVPISHVVVEVNSAHSVAEDSWDIDPQVVREMFTSGLMALTETDDPTDSWSVVIPGYESGEKISLKANTLNPSVPSSPALISAISESLLQNLNGLSSQDLFIWDRTEKELENAGILQDTVKVPCLGTFKSSDDESGPGYESDSVCLSGKKIHLSKLLTQQTDHLINVSVMKNHGASGFTGCMKNHYGSFSNPEDFHKECELHIARLNAIPEVTAKTRLFAMDALIGVSMGDTHMPHDCKPRKILLSFDPVAIDQRGMEIRDEIRAQEGMSPAKVAGYLQEAEQMGLGTRSYELVTIEI